MLGFSVSYMICSFILINLSWYVWLMQPQDYPMNQTPSKSINNMYYISLHFYIIVYFYLYYWPSRISHRRPTLNAFSGCLGTLPTSVNPTARHPESFCNEYHSFSTIKKIFPHLMIHFYVMAAIKSNCQELEGGKAQFSCRKWRHI